MILWYLKDGCDQHVPPLSAAYILTLKPSMEKEKDGCGFNGWKMPHSKHPMQGSWMKIAFYGFTHFPVPDYNPFVEFESPAYEKTAPWNLHLSHSYHSYAPKRSWTLNFVYMYRCNSASRSNLVPVVMRVGSNSLYRTQVKLRSGYD